MQWSDLIGEQKQQTYFTELLAFVEHERNAGKVIYPPHADVFNAFRYTPASAVKVVILGQDPYHGPNQAHGLCFSVRRGNPIPPSLRNIYLELSADIDGFVIPSHGELTYWATQGVLLLNSVLTVQAGMANSHKNRGWERFTDSVINAISSRLHNVIFMLWGGPAQKKTALIDPSKHHILQAPHPSPLSAHRGFIGCRHFSKANQILARTNDSVIDWKIPD